MSGRRGTERSVLLSGDECRSRFGKTRPRLCTVGEEEEEEEESMVSAQLPITRLTRYPRRRPSTHSLPIISIRPRPFAFDHRDGRCTRRGRRRQYDDDISPPLYPRRANECFNGRKMK